MVITLKFVIVIDLYKARFKRRKLHMSRIEFSKLSSCEVRRLNQFRTANLIRVG